MLLSIHIFLFVLFQVKDILRCIYTYQKAQFTNNKWIEINYNALLLIKTIEEEEDRNDIALHKKYYQASMTSLTTCFQVQ